MLDKEKIIESYSGDLNWLKEIERQVNLYFSEKENFEDIKKIINLLYKINYIVIETETEEYAEKYYSEIYDIYGKIKVDLTKMIGFEDFWKMV